MLHPAVKPLGNIHDGKSYAELDQKLQEARGREIRWAGTKSWNLTDAV